MKKTFLLTLAQTTEPAIPRDAELEAKIEKKLAEMSLDEKIGQMLELNLDVLGGMKFENAKIDRDKLRKTLLQFGQGEQAVAEVLKLTDEEIMQRMGGYGLDIFTSDTKRSWELNETVLDTTISKWKVGSVLNAPGKAGTVEQWQRWIPQIQEKSMQYLGIPDIYGLDNNHGVQHRPGKGDGRNHRLREPCGQLPLGV